MDLARFFGVSERDLFERRKRELEREKELLEQRVPDEVLDALNRGFPEGAKDLKLRQELEATLRKSIEEVYKQQFGLLAQLQRG